MKNFFCFVFISWSVFSLFPQDFFFEEDEYSNISEALEIYNYSFANFSNVFNPTKVLKILLGEKELLDSGLDRFSLAQVDNIHLRLLRNMIYAKYGLIFTSSELNTYFKKFNWYRARSNNVDNNLTEIDRYNIRLIQSFENRNEKSSNIIWGRNRVGVWQDMPVMAAGWSRRFVIYSNNRMEYYESQMINLGIFFGMSGVYEIKGNVLEFRVSEIYYIMHGFDIGYSGGWGYQFSDGKGNTIRFEKPIVFKFPISSIITKTVDGEFWTGSRETINIGGIDFFRMRDNPNDEF